MKKLIIISSLFLLYACDNENCDNENCDNENNECYQMGEDVTMEVCEANPKCHYQKIGVHYLATWNGKKCILNSITAPWFEYETNAGMPVCLEQYTGDIENDPGQVIYCKNLFNGVIFTVIESSYNPGPPTSEGWFPCEQSGIGLCSPECGNGIIEPGEQCDASQLGTVDSCAEFSEKMQWGGFTSGTITCDLNCRWDFTACASGKK